LICRGRIGDGRPPVFTHCEMIFISDELHLSGVFFEALCTYHPLGDLMNKSGTLITSALLTFGLAAASMAADAPKSGAPMAADAPAASTPAPAMKKHKKHRKAAAAAPATTK